MAKGDAILVSDLPPEMSNGRGGVASLPSGSTSGSSATAMTSVPGDLPALARALFQLAREDTKLKIIPWVERELIVQALQETGGNQVQASKLLGITRATLRKRIERFQITKELTIS